MGFGVSLKMCLVTNYSISEWYTYHFRQRHMILDLCNLIIVLRCKEAQSSLKMNVLAVLKNRHHCSVRGLCCDCRMFDLEFCRLSLPLREIILLTNRSRGKNT